MNNKLRVVLALLAALVLSLSMATFSLAEGDLGGLGTVDGGVAAPITEPVTDAPAGDAATGDAATGDVTGQTVEPLSEEQPSTLAALASTMLPMVLILVVFWLFLIRPQRKKDKKVKDMLSALKKGDRVCTIGGIYGTIDGIKDDTVQLIVGQNDTRMVIARWGIRSVEEVKIENDVGTDLT